MAKVFIEETTLSAIGDAIREKEGSSELVPVTEMASRIGAISVGGDLSEVEPLNAELEQILYGTDTGGKSFYHTFWDEYLVNGTRTDFAYAFAGVGWNDDNFKPPYTIKPTGSYMMFARTKISKISGIDFSSCAEFDYSFYYSTALKYIDLGSVPNCKKFALSFSSNDVLETVIIKDIAPTCKFEHAFRYASKLTTVDVTGTIGNDIDFGTCTKLSLDSFKSLRDHLSDTVMGKVCTFSNTAALAHFNTGTGGIDQVEWGNFCATKPNWTFILV